MPSLRPRAAARSTGFWLPTAKTDYGCHDRGDPKSLVNPLTETNDFGPFPPNMENRNTYRGPGRWNVDAVLAKRIRLRDRLSLQLRFEVYNLFNHANLYAFIYSADTTNPSPQITAFRGYVPDFTGSSVPGDGQRRIQLGAKLEF